MVLVLAALYTYYQKRQEDQKQRTFLEAEISQYGSVMELPEAIIFRPDVKREWLRAVFGPDFLESPSPSPSGVGLAQIPSYTAYSVSIPAQVEKIGMTVSRLPLGLYVHKISSGSEAFFAGIPIGAVLIAVNGVPMLAEPSRSALERIWQYEGMFVSDGSETSSQNEEEKKLETSNSRLLQPVKLEFIFHGTLVTFLMLSPPPWGISWAPCGNFPLVKRVYDVASEAGVKRGSLVARVNDFTFETMDHIDMANSLRDLAGHEISMTLCFPPIATRSSAYDRTVNTPTRPTNILSSPKAKWSIKSDDGVEVKFHPLEYALGSLCHVGGVNGGVVHGQVEEYAVKVSAGLAEAPTVPIKADGSIVHRRLYSPCPTMTAEEMMQAWDPLDALLNCLQLHAANYDDDRFGIILGHGDSPMKALRLLLSHSKVCDIVGIFLLQFIGTICVPGTPENNQNKGRAQELTSILLAVSRKEEGFCQRLYFLLRSFISTLETPRPQPVEEESTRNLSALLSCLELLRFAEKELAGRKSSKPSLLSASDVRADESVAQSLAATSVSTSEPASPVTISPLKPPAPRLILQEPVVQGSEKKGFFGKFRRKKRVSMLSSRSFDSHTGSAGSQSGSLRTSKSLGSPLRSKASERLSPRKFGSPRSTKSKPSSGRSSEKSLCQTPSVMYENMSDFLGELDRICGTIERSLQKSFRQKMADWALQPWSPSKDSALAEVTAGMRRNLQKLNSDSGQMLLVNPVDSTELLSSVDCRECYILPSAHFPILLTFNVSERRSSDSMIGEERLYRTKVELTRLKGAPLDDNSAFVIHAAVAGTIFESGESKKIRPESHSHFWQKGGTLIFDTRSTWGAPQTISLRLSSKTKGTADTGFMEEFHEVGYGWVDLSEQFILSDEEMTTTVRAEIWPVSRSTSFDEHGELPDDENAAGQRIDLKIKITTESIGFGDQTRDGLTRKRMLLYKHGDDLRQEAFAVQFILTCDAILKASGLDMKLLSFQCIPVGTKRGFVEWVPGSVPLSEICQPFAGSILADEKRVESDMSYPSMFTKAGLTKYESLRRLGGQQNQSLRRLGGNASSIGVRGSFTNNPIQDYLRSVAYDPFAPYLIRRDVMDTYVKSCAGYSVITYILGVGDRHLDNLLLHQSGSFFHCDFSFILGSDPKTYLPVRITEDMIFGMGGPDSDNYARFVSMVGAAFLALRRPENVRVLLHMVRLMEYSCVPDISENQTTERAVSGLRDRLRLDLNDAEAIAFMEGLIESSQASKVWIAVDAMHSLGKKF